MSIFKLTAKSMGAFIGFQKKAASNGIEITNVDVSNWFGGNGTKLTIARFDSASNIKDLVSVAMSLERHGDIESIEMDEALIRTTMAFKHS